MQISISLSLLVARDVLRGGTSVDWDQAPHCGKREKKIGAREKKVDKRSEPSASPRKGKGGRAWRHMPLMPADPPSRKISCHINVNASSSHHGCQRERIISLL